MEPTQSAYSGPTSPAARSRESRTFSFRSDKSGGSRQKEELVESPREKQRRDLIWKQGSKANPNAALSEAQPGVKAILEESTLSPLRGIQHKDAYGNVITDPDLSNPTRPRMERPLDTIRSFEKAIDNGYKRRSSYNRSEEQGSQYGGGRRNSGYGSEYALPPKRQSFANRLLAAHENGPNPGRYSNNGGYYGNQRQDGYGPGPAPKSRFPPSRMQSEPLMYSNSQQRPYPQGQHFSQDTINTGGSDSTGPWANSTDPSSENSSIERGPSAQKPYVDGGYGPSAHSQNGYNPNGYGASGFGQNGYGANDAIPEEGGAYPMRGPAPPVQPPNSFNRRPIPLGASSGPSGGLPPTKRPAPEKRKSWLKRTFSRKESN